MSFSILSITRIAGLALILSVSISCSYQKPEILTKVFDPKTQSISLYWKDDMGEPLKSLGKLKRFVESQKQTLQFAMNGGMYDKVNKPIGLYIENGRELNKLNASQGNASTSNFHIQPNGVFYLTQANQAVVCKTSEFNGIKDVKFATQSGPLLVYDSSINSAFRMGSKNRETRNGVGILPNGQVVFAMSKGKINFYDFADHFRSLGCRHALFLDGVVSQTYSPEQNWTDMGGCFGVMIAVVK